MMKFTPPLPPGYVSPSYEGVYYGIAAVLAGMILLFLVQAWGLCGLAKKQGLEKTWLAWIPGLDLWVLGSLGKNGKYRVPLLILGIITVLIPTILVGGFCLFCLVINNFQLQDIYTNWAILLVLMIGCGVMLAVLLLPVIVLIVLRDGVLGDVFRKFVPEKARLYGILSLFQLPIPVLICLCNKKSSFPGSSQVEG